MKKIKKSYCSGCKDNFYNGHNPYGIEECWALKDAEIVKKKFVPLDQRPPWRMPAETTLSCYRKNGYVALDPKVSP